MVTLVGMVFALLPVHAEQKADETRTLWYEAFSRNNPELLERWVDIPAPAEQPTGPQEAKALLADLLRTFPDLNLAITDVLQDGDKVVVGA